MINVGPGMKAQMDAVGDRPMAYHKWEDQTDDDGQPYKVESCLGAEGWYYSSNVEGPDNWINTGPLGR